VKFPADQPVLGWTVVIVFTYLAHIYDRHLRRVVLSRIPKIRRIESAEFPSEHRANAKHKLGELRRLLNSIDLRWMSSTFQVRARVVPFLVPRHQHAFLTPLLPPPTAQNIFLLPRVVYIEHQIINIFLEANTDELNLIVMSVELALILYKVAPSPAPTHPHL